VASSGPQSLLQWPFSFVCSCSHSVSHELRRGAIRSSNAQSEGG
jgi:hypothetical protein